MRVVETVRSCGRTEFDSKSCLSHQRKRAAVAHAWGEQAAR